MRKITVTVEEESVDGKIKYYSYTLTERELNDNQKSVGEMLSYSYSRCIDQLNASNTRSELTRE